MDVNHSGYLRHANDFYIEPPWCFDILMLRTDRTDYAPGVYDPAAGSGTIPVRAIQFGLGGIGTDLLDRPKTGVFAFRTRDFLEERTLGGHWPCIVMNPPFKIAVPFIEKGLREVRKGGVVCALMPISFLAAQCRHDWFRQRETERVVVLSRRPSMPDGDALLEGRVKASGGKANYVWMVFRAGGRRGPDATIDWGM